jgi:hypothetical protein
MGPRSARNNLCAGRQPAIGLWLSEPQANPQAGQLAMVGGRAYWVIRADDIQAGFAEPISYGQVPAGATDFSVES